jgi:mannose-6-phosphate isomerase-like protein (cupin superfamily)
MARAGEGCERPWGRYEVLAEDADHKVKRIVVFPGKRMSLQVHERRSEHWFVVRGSGKVTIGEVSRDLREGDAADIPKGCRHRIQNTGPCDLVFVEVQRGDYLGEDDIRRLEDDFGRC